MYCIKSIAAKDTIPIRHRVLREGKPVESCVFQDDFSIDAQHFGAFVDKKIVGVVSLFKNKNTTFNAESQWQIRGMAVLPEYQNKGFGRQLVLHCENVVSNKKCATIWFNARENAVNFYKKMDYKIIGSAFTIEKIGLHFVMYKKIEQAYE